MMRPFDEFAITADEFAITALLLVVVIAGMRLLYGAWPWEASKTWYCTRQAVAYVEALRGEKKRDPALRLVRGAVDTSSDSFDRSLVDDTSPPEVTPPAEAPPAAGQLQKSKSVRRRWGKSSQRMHPTRAETAPFTTGGSDGGDQAEQ